MVLCDHGNGHCQILPHNLPYNGDWLYWISVVKFCLNIVLFVSFSLFTIVRYTVYPEIWGALLRHPQQSLFLGTFSMGLATIINMVVFVCSGLGRWSYETGIKPVST